MAVLLVNGVSCNKNHIRSHPLNSDTQSSIYYYYNYYELSLQIMVYRCLCMQMDLWQWILDYFFVVLVPVVGHLVGHLWSVLFDGTSSSERGCKEWKTVWFGGVV